MEPLDLADLPDSAFGRPEKRHRAPTPFQLDGRWYRPLRRRAARRVIRSLRSPVVEEAQAAGLLVRTKPCDLAVVGMDLVVEHEALQPLDPARLSAQDLVKVLATYVALQRLLLPGGWVALDARVENFGWRGREAVYLDFDNLARRRTVWLATEAFEAIANLLAPAQLLHEGDAQEARAILAAKDPVRLTPALARRVGLAAADTDRAAAFHGRLAQAFGGLAPVRRVWRWAVRRPVHARGESAFLTQLAWMARRGEELLARPAEAGR